MLDVGMDTNNIQGIAVVFNWVKKNGLGKCGNGLGMVTVAFTGTSMMNLGNSKRRK
jgi:hypothetical protein